VNNRGTLEDVCLEALRGKPGFACLEEYFRCWEQAANCRPYPAKARFRAWMAAQADFDLRAGKAAEAGNLPWDSPAFGPLRDFLSVL
jgi:hypothetical protein